MNTQYKVNGVTYRQRFRKCSKPGCKCQNGEEHGPYWYSTSVDGSLKYVGIELPEFVTDRLQLLKASKKQLDALKEKIEKRRDDAYQVYERAGEQLKTIRALEAGDYCDSGILKSLGLAKFNGHK